jgi:hypothetical protein
MAVLPGYDAHCGSVRTRNNRPRRWIAVAIPDAMSWTFLFQAPKVSWGRSSRVLSISMDMDEAVVLVVIVGGGWGVFPLRS